jgi:hypothetical protein
MALLLVGMAGCRPSTSAVTKQEPSWGEGVPSALLAPTSGEPDDVSLLQLIANPVAFDGKRVRVIGFAHIEFEGQDLFLHREDFEHMLLKNALWLDVPLRPEVTKFNGRYMIVEGTFSARSKGHLGNNSGAIIDVSRYDPMPSREQLTKALGHRR